MSKKNQKTKKLNNLRREEEAVTSLFIHKLHALFQTRYREFKRNNYKSKDKGGERKSVPPEQKIKRTSDKSLQNIKNELKLLIAFYGIGTPHLTPPKQPELSREQISLIDIDFDGMYFTPEAESLSAEYRAAKENAADYDLIPFYKSSDYDLNNVPFWAEMKKFNSFRYMYRPICAQLAKINYPPEKLNRLNYNDLLDTISRHNREHPEHRMSNQRTRFLKMFSACYGEEFLEKMAILGQEKNARDFLTYIHYLDKPGRQCPQEVRYTANLFNVHHVKNRKHANELDDYSKVNDFSYLSLCNAFPHHKVLHTPVEIDLNPNIVFFGGFMNEFQITRNPEKERLYQQGMLKKPNFNRR